MTKEKLDATHDEQTDQRPLVTNFTEVKVIESIGASMLGILAVILLVALLRAHARNRALAAKLLKESE